jgi:hypothetical protein
MIVLLDRLVGSDAVEQTGQDVAGGPDVEMASHDCCGGAPDSFGGIEHGRMWRTENGHWEEVK